VLLEPIASDVDAWFVELDRFGWQPIATTRLVRPHEQHDRCRPYRSTVRLSFFAAGTALSVTDWSKVTNRPLCAVASASR
jgi:hypothetical protein